MVLKRKRSESGFSCSSTSTLSSPQKLNVFFHTSPALLHSRTMKRYRDNRPSEDEVHQHTLHLLYLAQQPQARPFSLQHHADHLLHTSAQSFSSTAQPSLHNFWRLPGSSSTRPQTPSPTVNIMAQTLVCDPPTSCGECGQRLALSGMSTCDDMEIDGSALLGDDLSPGSGSCLDCSKVICRDCSVTNLDEQRRCLACVDMQRKDARQTFHNRPSFFHP
ncbi:apoptosis regulatory protein Siva [Microdochium nivale]|nr:apoptosis regulatory protein Siva [Microdochium nivale]